MTDSQIVNSVLRSLASNYHRNLRVNQPLWSKVADFCGVGSTSAFALCREHGLDPYTGEKIEVEPQTKDENPYGYCPYCGNPVVARERRPNGNDTCFCNHTYPSRLSTAEPNKIVSDMDEHYREEKYKRDKARAFRR